MKPVAEMSLFELHCAVMTTIMTNYARTMTLPLIERDAAVRAELERRLNALEQRASKAEGGK